LVLLQRRCRGKMLARQPFPTRASCAASSAWPRRSNTRGTCSERATRRRCGQLLLRLARLLRLLRLPRLLRQLRLLQQLPCLPRPPRLRRLLRRRNWA
jgi:hypothetical protein